MNMFKLFTKEKEIEKIRFIFNPIYTLTFSDSDVEIEYGNTWHLIY